MESSSVFKAMTCPQRVSTSLVREWREFLTDLGSSSSVKLQAASSRSMYGGEGEVLAQGGLDREALCAPTVPVEEAGRPAFTKVENGARGMDW